MSKSRKSITDLILHIHPSSVPLETLRFNLSWGLGGMAAILISLLFVSGVLLLVMYQPSTEHAYASILTLTREIRFGLWVRNIHHWAANLLVIITILHLLRVMLTGAICPGRRLNWVIGLLLLFLLLSANFTGYLLPWDQLGFWAVTICTSMLGYVPIAGPWLQELLRGGNEVGPATLSNFFVLHVACIPPAMILFMFWHFWLVRKEKGLIRQEAGESKTSNAKRVPTVPHFIVREAAVGLVLIASILLMAIIWDAPLQAHANPGMSPNPAKAPWYFLGFQELLLHLHPVFAVCIWPLLGCIFFVGAPFLPHSALPAGIWFGSKRGSKLAVYAAVTGGTTTLLTIFVDNVLLHSEQAHTISTLITRGILPTVTLLVLAIALYLVLSKILKYSRAEVIMAGFILVISAMAMGTVVGFWFRGPEMHLILPWV